MPFWPLCCESEAINFCLKCFIPVTGLECSYGEIFIPVTEISVAKTEISVTGPARPLIWTHRYFYKEKSGEARSRKPSQPGWPGSYEEALSQLFEHYFSFLLLYSFICFECIITRIQNAVFRSHFKLTSTAGKCVLREKSFWNRACSTLYSH